MRRAAGCCWRSGTSRDSPGRPLRGREGELSVAVHVDDVLGAGGRFGEREASVLDDGGLAERVEVFDGLGGEDGVTLVQG